MRLVTRYLLREHLGPLVFSVTTLTSLLLLNYISKKFGDFVGKGIPWSVIGEFFVLSVPFTVAMTLPMAVLISTLYAFSRLAADSEITALMANGIGTRQLMAPVVGAGLLLSITMLAFNDQVLPRANQRLSSLQSSIAQKKPTLALKPQVLNEVSKNKGLYMWVAQLDERRNAMRDVTIYDLTNGLKRHTIVADSGYLAMAANRRDLVLTLFNGYVEETQTALPDRFQRTYFATDVMRVTDVANQLEFDDEGGFKSDREMTVCEMQTAVRRWQHVRDSTIRELALVDSVAAREYKPRYGSRTGEWYCSAIAMIGPTTAQAQEPPKAAQAQVPPKGGEVEMPVPQGARPIPSLPTHLEPGTRSKALRDQVTQAERGINMYEVEIQKKFALSMACLIFALLGPPIALRFPRSGVGLTIGVSIAVFAVYYVGLIAGESLADNLKASPAITMWGANFIFGTVALVLISRMSRTSATNRGGGFSALFDRILPWRRRALRVVS